MLSYIITVILNTSNVLYSPGITIKQIGDYIYLEGGNLGVMAKWDGRMTFHLALLGDLRGKTMGICGNFDDEPTSKSLFHDNHL